MARITQDFPSQSLHLASADYQPEREEYFERIGAERIEHTLLMSRSVWHKVREAKPLSLEAATIIRSTAKSQACASASTESDKKSQVATFEIAGVSHQGRGGDE